MTFCNLHHLLPALSSSQAMCCTWLDDRKTRENTSKKTNSYQLDLISLPKFRFHVENGHWLSHAFETISITERSRIGHDLRGCWSVEAAPKAIKLRDITTQLNDCVLVLGSGLGALWQRTETEGWEIVRLQGVHHCQISLAHWSNGASMPIPEIPGASGLVCLWKACDIVTWKIKIVIDCPVCQVLKLLIESFASIHVLIGTCMTVKPTHWIDLRYSSLLLSWICLQSLPVHFEEGRLREGNFAKGSCSGLQSLPLQRNPGVVT